MVHIQDGGPSTFGENLDCVTGFNPLRQVFPGSELHHYKDVLQPLQTVPKGFGGGLLSAHGLVCQHLPAPLSLPAYVIPPPLAGNSIILIRLSFSQ